MAARVRLEGRGLALVLATVVGIVGCTNPDRPSVQAEDLALPTPLRSFDLAFGDTLVQLQAALTASGSRLVRPQTPYRPSEPPTLLQLPRVVMRADLADPDDGYVVVYEAGSTAAAADRAQELAAYLGSGFGQTNFPVDAQFSVAVVGDTVIFTSWSRGRSSDPERAEAAFDAVASVGQAVEVRK